MESVVLITLHTGFNYGTLLQAYAMKKLIEECGYSSMMLWHSDGIIKGRDVTIAKLLTMLRRIIYHPSAYKKTVGVYLDNYSYKIDDETKQMFLDFAKDNFDITKLSFHKMRKLCYSDKIKACVCGSDQIWNADSLYVSPYYYLRFAPKNKRIAYAPSFGKTSVPDYNKKIIGKYLKDFKSISVREESGKNIVKHLVNLDVCVVLDPTLAIEPNEWKKIVQIDNSEKYILCYFLDEPKKEILELIKKIQVQYSFSIKTILYDRDCFNDFENVSFINAGPYEFLNLTCNASFVITDSFHSSIFSIIYGIPFYTVDRNHKHSTSQTTRIQSILNKLKLTERFLKSDESNLDISSCLNCDFSISWDILERERKCSKKFLKEAIEENNEYCCAIE